MATIRRRGKRYQVQIRKKGHPPISKSFSDRKTAETFAKDIEGKIERGVFFDTSLAERTTFRELVELYERDVLPTKKSYQTELYYTGKLKQNLGNHTVAEIQPFVLSKYRDLRLKTLSPASVRRELGLISRIFSASEKEFGIYLPHRNPVRRIRLPKEPRGRDRRISSEEESRILGAFGNNPIMRPLVIFALETAMRRTEIARMQWKDINWKAQTLHIPDTKTDIPRTIPLSDKAVETLRSLPRRIDGEIWGLEPHSISQAFRRACKRASIEDLHFHDLRHEAISRFFEKGLNIMEVASISGHQDLRMLRRYTHIRAETLVSRL